MDISQKIWDKSKTEGELMDTFRKLVQLNLLHNNLPVPEVLQNQMVNTHRDNTEFYNLISIIIKPDEDRSLREVLYEFYQNLDFAFLLNFFFRDAPTDVSGLNLDAMNRLKKILDEVILLEKRYEYSEPAGRRGQAFLRPED